MELTNEQVEALHKAPDEMLDVVDPTTNRQYVVVSRELLKQLRDEAEDTRHSLGWLKATQMGMASALGEEE